MDRSRKPGWAVFGLIALLGFGLAACSGSSSTSAETPTATQTTDAPAETGVVGVTVSDFAVALDSSTAPSGEVTFSVANSGPSTHEFVVFKTDLAPDQLPTDSDGDVEEAGEGVTHIDEIEDIKSGSTGEVLTVSLDAGAYVVLCNLPGHYGQGMHAAFSVAD